MGVLMALDNRPWNCWPSASIAAPATCDDKHLGFIFRNDKPITLWYQHSTFWWKCMEYLDSCLVYLVYTLRCMFVVSLPQREQPSTEVKNSTQQTAYSSLKLVCGHLPTINDDIYHMFRWRTGSTGLDSVVWSSNRLLVLFSHLDRFIWRISYMHHGQSADCSVPIKMIVYTWHVSNAHTRLKFSDKCIKAKKLKVIWTKPFQFQLFS